MIGVMDEWSRNWRETFLKRIYNGAASDGTVIYDRDALYGSRQRRSATLLPFSRTTRANIANITSLIEETER